MESISNTVETYLIEEDLPVTPRSMCEHSLYLETYPTIISEE